MDPSDLLNIVRIKKILPLQRGKHRLVDPVIMSLRVGAVLRIAGTLFKKTDAILRGDPHRFQLHPFSRKNLLRPQHRFLRHIFRGQVEQLFRLLLAHLLQGREQGRHGLADSRRGLEEYFLFILDRMVHVGRHRALALAVRLERKRHLTERGVPRLIPLHFPP